MRKKLSYNIEVLILVSIFLLALCFKCFADNKRWEGVVFHHSDSEKMSVEDCNAWHNARGWDGCGYNFLIQPDGEIQEARGYYKQGAHVKGHNHKYLGVVFVGKGHATKQQLEAFEMFVGELGLPAYPHSKFRSTACPGHILEQLKGSK